MEHIKRACHLQTETKTKCIKSTSVMTKSFRSKNIEPNGLKK